MLLSGNKIKQNALTWWSCMLVCPLCHKELALNPVKIKSGLCFSHLSFFFSGNCFWAKGAARKNEKTHFLHQLREHTFLFSFHIFFFSPSKKKRKTRKP